MFYPIRHVLNEGRTAKHLWIGWIEALFCQIAILFTNRLSIQLMRRCFAVPTRTQFSPCLENGEFTAICRRLAFKPTCYFKLGCIASVSSRFLAQLIFFLTNISFVLKGNFYRSKASLEYTRKRIIFGA
mgnify:CR=1 FL=1